jgi:hypothetical protein
MPLTGPPIVVLPGSRPPPKPEPEPSDHETTIAVLEGRQAPKVCPYCGRPWSPEARCVCQKPAHYVSPWARVWRWLVALVTPKPPPIVVLQGPTRQAPPKAPVRERLVVWVESGRRVPNMPEQVFDEAWPERRDSPRPPPSVRRLQK